MAAWGKVTLPFSQFKRTREGFMLENQHPMDTRNVTSLGIFVSGTPGPFRLEIEGIVAARMHEVWASQESSTR